jgi:hypothetical protein
MRTVLAALAVFAGALPILADEVELTSGKIVEGKVEDLGDSIRLTRSGGSVVYPKSMVAKITPKKTVEELYEDQSKALKADDALGRLKLARWCLDRKIAKEAAAEYRKVVAVDPDNEEARLGAGYRRHNDKWMTEDEVAQAKGLVKHRGRWLTPEERDLEVALDEQKELEKSLLREVQLNLEKIRSSDEKKRQEGAAVLSNIEDKLKVKSYLAAITSSSKEVRRFVFEELGRMKEPQAAKPLVRRALWDEEESLRDLAFKSLLAIKHPDTALFYVPFLEEQSVSARTRAAEQMASFPDLRAVPPLLEALENAIASAKTAEQYGQEMTATVNREVILQNGQRVTLPRVVRIKPDFSDKQLIAKLGAERSAIVSTLGAITSQGFGEDVAKWRAWLDRKRAGKE